MKWLVKIFKKSLIKVVVDYLEDKKDDIADKANDAVDLPGLNEREEQKLFEATVDATFDKIIEKIKEM